MGRRLDNGFRPTGLTRLSSTTVDDLEKAAGFTAALRPRHRHAFDDACTARIAVRSTRQPDTRSCLRRRHGAVVLGPSTGSTRFRRRPPTSECSRRTVVSPVPPTWPRSRPPCSPASSAATASTDTTRADVNDRRAGRRARRFRWEARHRPRRASDPVRRRRGRRGVSFDGGATWRRGVGAGWSYDWVPAAVGDQ